MIELMVTVALIGIVSAVVLPGFSYFLNTQRMNVSSTNIYTSMQIAKAAAIEKNTRMTIFLDESTGNWCIFDRNVEPTDVDCDFASNTLASGVIRKYIEPLAAGISIENEPSGATQITYDGFGRIVPNPDGSETLTSVALTMPKDANRANTIMLDIGQPRLCNPKKPSGDPQAC